MKILTGTWWLQLFTDFLWTHFEISESRLAELVAIAKQKITRLNLDQKTRLKVLEQIGARIENGLPIAETINELVAVHQQHSKKSDPARKLLEQMAFSYNRKPNLIETLKPYYPATTMSILASVKQGGSIDNAIRLTTEILRLQSKQKAKMRKGLLSPMIYLIVSIGFAIFAKFALYDKLQRSLPKEVLDQPIFANTITTLNSFVYGLPYFAVIFLGVIIWIRWSLPNQIRFRPNAIPPWSLFNTNQSVMFIKSYAALQAIGLPVVEALATLERYATRYSHHHIKKMRIKVSQAVSPAQALASDYFDKDSRIEIQSYARSKHFHSLLGNIADEVIETTDNKIERILAISKISSLLIMAGELIFIFGPLYVLNDYIK